MKTLFLTLSPFDTLRITTFLASCNFYITSYFLLLLSLADDQIKALITFSVYLPFVQKHCDLLDIHSWLASNNYHQLKETTEPFEQVWRYEQGSVTDVVHRFYCMGNQT